MNSLRLYKDKNFADTQFEYIPKSWALAYQKTIQTFSSRAFLTCHTSSNSVEKNYLEFNLDVLRVHGALIQKSPHQIAACANNTYPQIVVIFAALLYGKKVTLLNPNDTPARLEKNQAQLGEDLLFIDDAAAADLLKNGTAVSTWPEQLNPERIAVQIFTSGSTGYGKVVCLTESNILTNIEALLRHHQFQSNDIIGTQLPISHVNALFFSVFCSFFSGIRLVLWDRLDTFQLAKSIASHKVTILSTVPTQLALFLKVAVRLPPETFSSVRYVVSAASALSPETLIKFEESFNAKIFQGYGLSETVNFSTLMPIDLPLDSYHKIKCDGKYTSIGCEIFGNHVNIVTPEGHQCSEGQVGEIVIRGLNVMAGYDKANIQPFKNDYFHSGDLGYYKILDGRPFFFIVGRIKDVIKRAGATINLRETDDRLQDLQSVVTDIIAFSYLDPIAGEELGIAIQIGSECDLSTTLEQIKGKILAEFAQWERPRSIVILKGNLRTSSSKPRRQDVPPYLTLSQPIEEDGFLIYNLIKMI